MLSLLTEKKEDEEWTLDWKGGKSVKLSKCLTRDSKCFSNRMDDAISIDTNGTRHKFSSKNPCIIPFKDSNTTYNSCTRFDSDGFWCATSVDADLEWQTWGFCNDLCPLEGIIQVF